MLKLFEKYRVRYLAEVTGYNLSYIRNIKSGRPPPAKFRRMMALALGEDETELFQEIDEENNER